MLQLDGERKLRDETVAHRRLGRLQGENRAAKAFDIKIERLGPTAEFDTKRRCYPSSWTQRQTDSPTNERPKRRNAEPKTGCGSLGNETNRGISGLNSRKAVTYYGAT
jgi:hypothetical protein